MNYYLLFDIDGLELCDFSYVQFLVENCGDIYMIELTKSDDKCVARANLSNKEYNLQSSGYHNQKQLWVMNAKQAIYKIILKLINEGHSIYELEISLNTKSYWLPKPKDLLAEASITITNNISLPKKELGYIGVVYVGKTDITYEKEMILNILSTKDKAFKYMMLYQILKKKCGGSQGSVSGRLESDGYDNKYQIFLKNDNIDSNYANGHPNQAQQDDFTYLRTIIGHIRQSNIKELIHEYNKRIDRDTCKIVQVLFDILERESN